MSSLKKTLSYQKEKILTTTPLIYFTAVIDGSIQTNPHNLSSLENNIIVKEILDAAIKSYILNQTLILE